MRKQYFETRNSERQNDNTTELAQREIENLCLLLSRNTEILPDRATVVDLGCGDRYLEAPVRALGAEYIGYDIDSVDLIKDKVPLQSESVDLVLCYSVLEHLSDPTNLFLEASRILKKNGLLVIETPNWHYSQSSFYNDFTHCKPYTPISLKALCSSFSFESVEISPNLRCKPNIFYLNRWKFWIAASLPLRGYGGLFKIFKGKSLGIIGLFRKK